MFFLLVFLASYILKGPYFNYVDRFLQIFDHLPTPRRQTQTFGLPPTLCLCRRLENDHPPPRRSNNMHLFLLVVIILNLISFQNRKQSYNCHLTSFFLSKHQLQESPDKKLSALILEKSSIQFFFVYVDIEKTTYLPHVDKTQTFG